MIDEYFIKKKARKIADLIRPFRNENTIILYPSEESYSPMDGHTMHLLMRLFPIDLSGIQLIPVYKEIPKIENSNVIIIGRLWIFGKPNQFNKIVSNNALSIFKYRFCSSNKIINFESGQVFERRSLDYLSEDFGTIRFFIDSGKGNRILHIAGLGPIGTFGAIKSLLSNSDSMILYQSKLPETDNNSDLKIEALIKTNWTPSINSYAFNPDDTEIKIFDISSGNISINLPIIVFRNNYKKGKKKVSLKTTFDDTEYFLSSSSNHYQILSIIAEYTNKNNFYFEEEDAFISYSEIYNKINSEGEKKIPIASIRASMSTIRGKLNNFEISKRFPNLLLDREKKNIEGGPNQKEFRLRARSLFL